MLAIVSVNAECLYLPIAIHACIHKRNQTIILQCIYCHAKAPVTTGKGAQVASVAEIACMGTESTGYQVYISTHQ